MTVPLGFHLSPGGKDPPAHESAEQGGSAAPEAPETAAHRRPAGRVSLRAWAFATLPATSAPGPGALLAALHAVAGTRPSNEARPNAAMTSAPAASATACPEVLAGRVVPARPATGAGLRAAGGGALRGGALSGADLASVRPRAALEIHAPALDGLQEKVEQLSLLLKNNPNYP